MWGDLPAGLELPPVFIGKHWLAVNQKKEKTASSQMIYEKSKLIDARAAFVSELEAAGFPVTHDVKNLPEGTIHLTNSLAGIITQKVIGEKALDTAEKKIARCCAGENVPQPESLKIDEYLSDPFFPAVFKSECANRGVDKYFIETPEQLQKIVNLRAQILPKTPPKYQQYFNYCIFQRYITPPEGFHSSIRVMASASEDVLAAGLIYNETAAAPTRTEVWPLDVFFNDPKSPYFLNCKNILSNRAAGGDIIGLNAPRFSADKSRVLKAHGLDPANLSLPENMERAAGKIAKECNTDFGILCGVDFIYHALEKRWYLLEVNLDPSMGTYALAKGQKLPDSISVFYLDIEARREALRKCVMKRHLS
jgi:hypothetical protein